MYAPPSVPAEVHPWRPSASSDSLQEMTSCSQRRGASFDSQNDDVCDQRRNRTRILRAASPVEKLRIPHFRQPPPSPPKQLFTLPGAILLPKTIIQTHRALLSRLLSPAHSSLPSCSTTLHRSEITPPPAYPRHQQPSAAHRRASLSNSPDLSEALLQNSAQSSLQRTPRASCDPLEPPNTSAVSREL